MGVFEIILLLAVLNGVGPLVAILLNECDECYIARDECRQAELYHEFSKEQ